MSEPLSHLGLVLPTCPPSHHLRGLPCFLETSVNLTASRRIPCNSLLAPPNGARLKHPTVCHLRTHPMQRRNGKSLDQDLFQSARTGYQSYHESASSQKSNATASTSWRPFWCLGLEAFSSRSGSFTEDEGVSGCRDCHETWLDRIAKMLPVFEPMFLC